MRPNSRYTSLERLRAALGVDAELLDSIPIDQVQIELGERLLSYSPYRIHVGIFKRDGYDVKIWAYMSELIRHDGSLDIKFWGEDRKGQLFQHRCDEIVKLNQWLDLFKVGMRQKTTSLIKCCFILKGVPLPSTVEYKEGFLSTLKRACRNLRDGHARDSLPEVEVARNIKASENQHKFGQLAIKTQRSGPQRQLYNITSDDALQEKTYFPDTSNYYHKGAQHDHHKSMLGSVSPTMPPQMPRAMRKDTDRSSAPKVHFPSQYDQISRAATTTYTSAHGSIQHDLPYSRKIQDRSTPRWTTPRSVTPPRLGSIYSTQGQRLSMREASTGQVLGPGRSEAGKSQIRKRRSAEYFTLQEQMGRLEDNLNNIDSAMRATDARFSKLKAAKTRQIDVDTRERHYTEIKKLNRRHDEETRMMRQRHKEEVYALKSQYTALKVQHQSEKVSLDDRRNIVMHEKAIKKETIKRSHQGLSQDKMTKPAGDFYFRDRSYKRQKTEEANVKGEDIERA